MFGMEHYRKSFLAQATGILCASAMLSLLLAPGAFAQKTDDEKLNEASIYATGLMQWGLNDYARSVIEEITKVPGSAPKVLVFDIRASILSGDFAEADRLLKQMNLKEFDSWPTILEAADGYFAQGMWDKAQYWYDLFFQTFPNCPTMKDPVYKDAAYRYSQILEKYVKNHEKALKALEYALAARPTTDEKAPLMCDAAELALKVAEQPNSPFRAESIEKARKYAEELQWRYGGTIWFGKSVVILAHIKELQNDRAGAMALITEFMPQLQEVHDALEAKGNSEVLKLTPMAECRYLLGKMNYTEGMKLISAGKKDVGVKYLAEAINHLFNVFARYPSTPWASHAGKLAQDIFDYFDANRIKYTRPASYQLIEVLNIQLKEAYMLLLGRQLDEAREKYEDLLAMFPEMEPSMRGVGELARCYYDNNEPDVGEAVYNYLIERFANSPRFSERAGDSLLILAGVRKDAGDLPTATAIYDSIIRAFPKHPKRAVVVQYCGDVKRDAGDLDGALSLYQQLKETDEGYEASLFRIAQVYGKKKEYDKQIECLKRYMERLKPSHEKARTQYLLAGAYAQTNSLPRAAAAYKLAVDWLKSGDYAPTPEEGRKNAELLGPALYNLASICSKLDEPAEKKSDFQKLAIKMFGEFAVGYPKSDLTPAALLKMGILQMVQGDGAGATKTFDLLAKLYPDCDEAKRMYFVRIRALLEMKYVGEAKKSVEKMINNAGQYKASQFMEVAKLIGEYNETALSVKCYEQATSMVADPVKERWILEGALYGLGELYSQTRRFPECAESIKRLFLQYPNTGLTIDAAFMQSDAYAEMAASEKDAQGRFELFNEAVAALNRVSRLLSGKEKRVDAGELSARVTLKAARISEMKATAESSFGDAAKAKLAREDANAAYFRLFLFSDPKTPGIGPYVEEAFFRLIPYERDAGRHTDIEEYCRKYEEMFPGGKYREQAERWREEAVQNAKAAPAAAVPAAQTNEQGGAEAPAPGSPDQGGGN